MTNRTAIAVNDIVKPKCFVFIIVYFNSIDGCVNYYNILIYLRRVEALHTVWLNIFKNTYINTT